MIFTPRLSSTDHRRLKMDISKDDLAKTGRGTWRAVITDRNTGAKYKVRGAACGIPHCHCDAVILAKVRA